MSTGDGQGEEAKKEGDALVSFLLENRTLMNFASIIMIVYAVWATIEVITNAYGATWWPPETGIPADELFNNPDRTQNINNGLIIGLGAVCGTLGFLIQYFYRAAPYVDASMTATAALIIHLMRTLIRLIHLPSSRTLCTPSLPARLLPLAMSSADAPRGSTPPAT